MAEATRRGNCCPSEKAIVNSIMRYLEKLPGCYAFKTHGSIYGSGQPDIVGCIKGRAFALEVKRPGGKPTKLQVCMLEKWKSAGAVTGVVHSVDEVKEVLESVV